MLICVPCGNWWNALNSVHIWRCWSLRLEFKYTDTDLLNWEGKQNTDESISNIQLQNRKRKKKNQNWYYSAVSTTIWVLKKNTMHNSFLAGTSRWQPWSHINERSIIHSYRTDDVHWKPYLTNLMIWCMFTDSFMKPVLQTWWTSLKRFITPILLTWYHDLHHWKLYHTNLAYLMYITESMSHQSCRCDDALY